MRRRLAVYQPDAAGRDKAGRLALLERAMRALGRGGADLIVCPELYMSGYNVGDAVHRLAEPADGPFAKAVAGLARDWRMAVVYGYPETADGRIYNAALALGPGGERLANHRKLALPPGREPDLFSPGHGLTLFDVAGTRATLLICYDAEFPEAVRAAAAAGAEVVVVPTALAERWSIVANRMIPTRALENGVFLAYANHAGREDDLVYLGQSCIVGPDGGDLARAGAKEEIIVAEIDLAAIAAMRARLPYLAHRSRMPTA